MIVVLGQKRRKNGPDNETGTFCSRLERLIHKIYDLLTGWSLKVTAHDPGIKHSEVLL